MARAFQQTGFRRVKRGYKPLKVEVLVPGIKPAEDPTDPYFPLQWYLKNTGQNGGKVKLDLNVEAAWAQGITGKNVTTAIMDDGKSSYLFQCFAASQKQKASYILKEKSRAETQLYTNLF